MDHTSYVAVKFLTELLLLAILFVFPFGRRKWFFLRAPACLLACFGVSIACSPLVIPYHTFAFPYGELVGLLRYTLLFFCVVFSCLICFRIDFQAAMYCCIGAYAIQHIFAEVCGFIERFYLDIFPTAAIACIYAALLLVFFGLFYVFLIRKLHNTEDFQLKRSDTIGVSVLLLLSTIVLHVFVSATVQTLSVWGELALAGYGVICGIFILYLESDIFRRKELEKENSRMEYVLEQEKRQFQAFRAGVDYLDVKCHDLKHQIRLLKEKASADPAVLSELEASIAAYESYAQTGSAALDIILAEKFLECSNAGIQFSAMVKSRYLSRFADSDIYSLFGNALENAIEHEKKLDAEKRFIRLSVKDVGQMMFVRAENYFEGELKLKDGLPVSDKEDKRYHGFGMRSMRLIAARYGGTMRVDAEQGLFYLQFVFPFAD